MRRNPKVADARNEWGNMSLMIRPVYDPCKSGALGITKAQMMQSVKSISDGTPIGIYRDNEKKVPVLLKSEGVHITDEQIFRDFSVLNGEHSAPLSQITEKIETTLGFRKYVHITVSYPWQPCGSEAGTHHGGSAWRNTKKR